MSVLYLSTGYRKSKRNSKNWPTMTKRIALLYTTIKIDRKKTAERGVAIDNLINQFDFAVTTSICLLEFKATIIAECITIHDNLRLTGLYTRVADRLTESTHPQAKLRRHIFSNLVNVFAPSSFDVTEAQDRELADQCRLLLESVIVELYTGFSDGVIGVISTGIDCTRASEAPEKKRTAFGTNLPQCKRGENKFCKVEEFIRTKAAPLLERLEQRVMEMPEIQSGQLRQTCELIRTVIEDHSIELSHHQCRRAGDLLIALEGMEHATHALSTNAREWAIVSDVVGLEFVQVTY
jgi:hypothetical protein